MLSDKWRQMVRQMVRRSRPAVRGAASGRRSGAVRLEALEDRTLLAFDLTISTNPTANVTVVGGMFTANATGANIDVADIQSALAGNDIDISSGAAGMEAGNITWNAGAALDFDGTGFHIITLTSGTGMGLVGDITFAGTIADGVAGGDGIALVLFATQHVAFDAPGSISTGGGSFFSLGINSSITGAINTAGGGDISLTHAGTATLSGNLDAGGGNILLAVDGGTTQPAGTLVGAGLRVTSGTFILNQPTNDVDVLAVNAGTITLVDADDLTVGVVAPESGITTGGIVSLTVGGLLTIDQPIAAGGNLVLTAADVEFTGAGSASGAGLILLQPTLVATPILIAGGVGGFNLSAADVAALVNGFSSIVIGRADGQHVITINAVTFFDPVTIRTPVAGSIAVNGTLTGADNASITLDGPSATTTLNADIVTAGNPITISDNVILGAPATITLDTTNGGAVAAGANITITGTIEDDVANTTGLTLRAGTAGNIDLQMAVGGTVAPASLTVISALTARFGGAVTTAGAQNVTATTIQTNGTHQTTNSAITFTGNVTLQNATILNAGAGNITVTGTVNGAFTLAANSTGATTFGGAVGGTTALTSLTTDAGGTTAINGGAVTTTGAQTYNDPVTLGAAVTTLTSTGAGAITFGNTVNGASALTVNTAGATTFGGAVSGTTPLASLTTDAGGTVSLLGVTTTGAQTYNDATVTLNGTYTTTNSPFTVVNAALLAGNTVVTTGSGAITFGGTINGAFSLTTTSSGITTFGGNIGAVTALTTLTVNVGAAITFNDIIINATTAVVNGNGATTLTMNYTVLTTWNVNAANAGAVFNSRIGTVGGLAFNGVANLVGGPGDDTFTFLNNAATLTGGVNGNGGTNAILYIPAVTANRTFNVTGLNSGTVGGFLFSNVQNLTGGSGNDQFLFSGGRLTGTISGTAGTDTITATGGACPFVWTLTLTDLSDNGGRLFFYVATFEQLILNAIPGQCTQLVINNGTPGAGTLVAFPATGAPLPPPFGILYNGGGVGTNSSLRLTGGGGAGFTTRYSVGPGNGDGRYITQNAGGTLRQTLQFTGLAPIVDDVLADSLTIDATDAANIITVDNGTAAGDGFLRVRIDAFEPVEFANKTNVIINAGLTAADAGDTLVVNFTETATGLATVTLNGLDGNDVFTVNAAVVPSTLNGGNGNDTVTVNTNALTGSVTVNGDAGTDTLIVNGTAAADTFTVNNSTVARAGSATITYATLEQLTVNGQGGNDVLNVQSTGIATTVNGGDGDDSVNVSSDAPINLGNLDGILGNLTVDVGTGTNTMVVSDFAGTAPFSVLTPTQISGLAVGLINYAGPPAGSLLFLTLRGSDAFADVFTVVSTAANTPTRIEGNGGSDAFSVFGTAVSGPLTLLGGAANDTFQVIASNALAGSVTINGGTPTPPPFPTLGDNLFVTGTAAADTFTVTNTTVVTAGAATITFADLEMVVVSGEAGNDTFNIVSTSVPTTVNGGTGDDVVNVGSDPANVANSNLDGILGALTVNGDAGADTLNFNDQGTTANSIYTLANSAFQRSGTAVVTYATTETVNLNAGSGSDTINVVNTPAGVLTTVSPGGGTNTVNVGSNPVNLAVSVLDGVQGQLNINNDRGGINTLNLNDQGSATNNNYVLFNSLTRNGVSNIFVITAGGQLQTLNLNAGSGNDTVLSVFSPPVLTLNMNAGIDVVNLQVTSPGSTTTVNGGAGDDGIQVGGAANTLDTIQGAVTVNGDSGSDTMNVNDSGNTTGTRYEITATSVRRPNVRITYATLEALNLVAGTGNDAIIVLSTHAGVTNVNGNAGDDSFSLCAGIAGPTNVNGLDGSDQFALAGGTDLRGGFIVGGGGVNTLNYSGVTPAGAFAGFATPVVVNLSTTFFSTVLQGFLPPPNGNRTINVAALSATGTGGIGNIQNVIGGSGDDILIGNDLPNQLEGRLGNDLLFGQGGNDFLLGGPGYDVLYGGDGNDLIDALAGEQSATAVDTQQNFLFGGNGDDVLFARSAQDQLFGEGGRDRLVIRNCADFLAGQLTLDIGADGGSITILDFALVNQNGQPATPPPVPLVLSPLDCNPTLPAAVPEAAAQNAVGDDVTALPSRFLGAAEGKANLVRGYYLRFLGRAPEAAGMQAWLEAFARGAQPEDVLAGVLGSEEYFARQGGDLAAFVRSMYTDLLGRVPAEAEVAGWVRVLGATPRAVVVRGFAGSDEFRTNLIQSWYGHYLGRAADASGLQAWLARMRAGATQDQVQAALLASAEYREVAGRAFGLSDGDGSAAYVRSLYGKVLGRVASEAEVAAWLQVI